MKRLTFLLGIASIAACNAAQGTANPDIARWDQQARNVTITRDDWGIAHVHGKTDADAVFGLVCAQAEDDFNRVETNYINSMGRLAESEGEKGKPEDRRFDGKPRLNRGDMHPPHCVAATPEEEDDR